MPTIFPWLIIVHWLESLSELDLLGLYDLCPPFLHHIAYALVVQITIH